VIYLLVKLRCGRDDQLWDGVLLEAVKGREAWSWRRININMQLYDTGELAMWWRRMHLDPAQHLPIGLELTCPEGVDGRAVVLRREGVVVRAVARCTVLVDGGSVRSAERQLARGTRDCLVANAASEP
jgi:hypothetical protein